MKDLRYVLAVDPGEKHVGVAAWAGALVEAQEIEAREALPFAYAALESMRDKVRVTLVIEEFRLYPHRAGPQTWAKMGTSEMIGALKWSAMQLDVEWVEQPASIKESTRRQLKARGIRQVGKGPHARDAELHLYYYLLREQLIGESK